MKLEGFSNNLSWLHGASEGLPVPSSLKTFSHLTETTPLKFEKTWSGGNNVAALLSKPLPLPVVSENKVAVLRSTTSTPNHSNEPQLNWTAAQWRAHERQDFFNTDRLLVLGEAGFSVLGGGALGLVGKKLLGPVVSKFLPDASRALPLETKIEVIAGVGKILGDKAFGNKVAQEYLGNMLKGKWTKETWRDLGSDGKSAIDRVMKELYHRGQGNTATLLHNIQMGRASAADISGKARGHLEDVIQWLGRNASNLESKERFLIDVAKELPK